MVWSTCCLHGRVVLGDAGERWHKVMQTWQAVIRTVISTDELSLGLSKTREG